MENEQEPTVTEPEFDIEAGAASIAADLFHGGETPEPEAQEAPPEPEVPHETEVEPAAESEEPVQTRPVPKTWPKEMHEFWGKTDPKVQEYWEQREEQMMSGLAQYKDDASYGKTLRAVLDPYKPIIAAQGIDEPRAVQFLLNAHYKLSTAPEAEKSAYFAELAKQYHVDLGKMPQQQEASPELRSLQDQLAALQSTVKARDTAALTEAQSRVKAEVNRFASDPAHPYFDEVADDIVAMLRTGAELPDAYEKAVWANPVTRAKEIARIQTDGEAKAKEKKKEEAEAAKKATSANVRGRDTNRTPTEPLGTMEDTMKETLSKIKSRAV